eukprot:CAMPEP_0205826458 /NCGR_PEP_ID=MMETSP0206-20130828/28688_1 /ASSEMBLY_ACC=CAM_ASM_000279 /TAXON_ID=36767 /ORGANISM="Euplotes focardii, Strain TN1" /LENGTH=474 /DNA_ID=CAMNT_0053126395 /DNA_START=26 /DNA_END=1450 /DNA_ORIENTATION=+
MPRFGGAPKCAVCNKSAYPQESEQYDKLVYHKACFKCKECKRHLTLSSIAQIKGTLYCKNCFARIFKARGKYDDFGEHTQAKAKGKGYVKEEFVGMEAKMSKEEAEKKKFEDSNIAKIGTAEDKAVRKAAADTEAAWEGAGQKPGVEIWRIEKFKVVHWPKADYGKFYDGDSYIVMRTYMVPDTEKLAFDLHFWLGSTTSQDEAGTAAYKTVELDDYLDQVPVQFREVSGHESDAFLAIFDGTIQLLQGGVESGFRKVKPEEYKPRLLHCKGKNNNVRVEQVEMAVASLNKGDAFILDAGLTIYQWNGPGSGVAEKNKCRDIRLGLVDERNQRPKSVILDGCEEDEAFWALLGADAVPAEDELVEATDDSKVEEFEKVAFKLSDDTGSLVIEEIGRGDANINMQIFGSTDAYILDCGHTVFVYIGINASKAEKRSGIKFATDYLSDAGRPMWTPITRVLEGGAVTAFRKAVMEQ